MKYDMNLIRILVSILEEGTMTAAANRLGLTQPALSHALRRLRDIAGDELFVRTARGMTPTTRAHEIYERACRHLNVLEDIFSRAPEFDPVTSTRSFTVGMSDYGMAVLLPRLINNLQQAAPELKIQTRYYAHGSQFEDLQNGNVELSIALSDMHPDWIEKSGLFDETAVGVAAENNELFGKSVALQEYLAARHVIMAPGREGRSWVDDQLAMLGHVRDVAHTLPHFTAIPAILDGSHFISTLPRRIAQRFTGEYGLRCFELPFQMPVHTVVQMWHRRNTSDPGHCWLRRKIQEVATELDEWG